VRAATEVSIEKTERLREEEGIERTSREKEDMEQNERTEESNESGEGATDGKRE
jgi:hypothetical protein